MTDWVAVLREDLTMEGDLELGVHASENAAPPENQPMGALVKLGYAVRLNARLQSLEGERSHIHSQLFEINMLLQTEKASLQSENTQNESRLRSFIRKLK
jgi:hypothetical protein